MNNRGRTSRTFKDYLGLGARGVAMGAADVVPGVSGGTMAFILGIYEELIDSIRTMTSRELIALLVARQFRAALEIIPWKFLAALASGILLAAISLSRFLKWALETHPELIWSFFFGLVLASIIMIYQHVEEWNRNAIVGTIIGAVATYLVIGVTPARTADTPLLLFMSGFIAICAMILPGISGSFILVLLGKYQSVITAVSNAQVIVIEFVRGKGFAETITALRPELVIICLVASGCVLGIVSFSHVLAWLLSRYRNTTIAFLTGVMVGSLRKIWPWKETISEIENRHGEMVPLVQLNVIPRDDFVLPIIMGVIGFGIVLVMERLASRQSPELDSETSG